MELIELNNTETIEVVDQVQDKRINNSFIQANTKEVSLTHLKNDCIVPVFSKDNECTISHHQFIESLQDSVALLCQESEKTLCIRASHVVKGRIPSAIGKAVKELEEDEKTIYYERMMFLIEIPSITRNINGDTLNLTLGGVRAYNQENLYSRKTLERFKIFIGFQNTVCTNLCVSTDGLLTDLRVASVEELADNAGELIRSYDMDQHVTALAELPDYYLKESEFAHLMGRLRLFNHSPKNEIHGVPGLSLTDMQLNSVIKEYYLNPNFCRAANGDIDLWKLYNLFTGANKASYIDTFLARSANAYVFVNELKEALEFQNEFWHLN